jgi:hypothetical protein
LFLRFRRRASTRRPVLRKRSDDRRVWISAHPRHGRRRRAARSPARGHPGFRLLVGGTFMVRRWSA